MRHEPGYWQVIRIVLGIVVKALLVGVRRIEAVKVCDGLVQFYNLNSRHLGVAGWGEI